jgi:cell fate regulator YaaT (PSP1 superfamily)
MCCLKYENELYEEAKGKFPETGSKVVTPLGPGKVTAINIFKKTLTVELLESKVTKEYTLSDLGVT